MDDLTRLRDTMLNQQRLLAQDFDKIATALRGGGHEDDYPRVLSAFNLEVLRIKTEEAGDRFKDIEVLRQALQAAFTAKHG